MDNPYVCERPLGSGAEFHNRVSELVRASSRIAADRPQSVSIVGGPRTGKSSVLRRLGSPADLDDPGRYVLLRLDLARRAPRRPRAFFARVAQALAAGGEPPMEPGYDGFNRLVKRLGQEGRRLILFCDDFDLVTSNPGFPVDFFSFLRAAANGHDVGYVTTSRAPLPQRSHLELEESPFFNIFTTVTLEPFAAEAARRLVEEPARQAGAPFGAEAEWILELGGASPYLLQLGGSLAFELRLRGAVTAEALATAAFRQARGHLTGLWRTHFTAAQRQVLRALAAGRQVECRLAHAADALERQGYLMRRGAAMAIHGRLLERYVDLAGRSWWRRLGA